MTEKTLAELIQQSDILPPSDQWILLTHLVQRLQQTQAPQPLTDKDPEPPPPVSALSLFAELGLVGSISIAPETLKVDNPSDIQSTIEDYLIKKYQQNRL